MKSVRYARGRKNFSRVLRVKDLDQLGIPHLGKDLTWDNSNGFTNVMSNKMSDSLVSKLPNEFIMFDVDGDDEAPEAKTAIDSLNESAMSDSQSSLFDPEIDPIDDDESLTGDDDPVD